MVWRCSSIGGHAVADVSGIDVISYPLKEKRERKYLK